MTYNDYVFDGSLNLTRLQQLQFNSSWTPATKSIRSEKQAETGYWELEPRMASSVTWHHTWFNSIVRKSTHTLHPHLLQTCWKTSL